MFINEMAQQKREAPLKEIRTFYEIQKNGAKR